MKRRYPEIDQLMHRLEQVEKQNRRMKGLTGALATVVLAFVFLGAQSVMQEGQFRKITAQEITIVDSTGKTRLEMGSTNEGTGIRILSEQGKRIVGLGIAADGGGSGMLVADRNGVPRLGLGMDEGIPSLAITNKDGRKIIGLGGDDKGYGFVVMDADEVERGGFGIDGKGNTGFVLYDSQGQYVRGMIRQQDGVHYSSYVDENGKEVIHR
jgi:hypothetical protein